MRPLPSAARLLGWGAVAALGVLAVLRVAAWDTGNPILLGLHGLGPLPYLAAVPVALLALAARQGRLAAVTLTVAAVVVPTGLPEYAASAGEPLGTRTSPGLSLLSWNLYVTNAVLRIDHVLTGRGLTPTSYRTGPAGGGDHRSIVVGVAIKPAVAPVLPGPASGR